jgi:death-on-curing protein
MTDDDLPSAEEILATHEEIEEDYDMKYRGTAVAAPQLKLRRLLASEEAVIAAWG